MLFLPLIDCLCCEDYWEEPSCCHGTSESDSSCQSCQDSLDSFNSLDHSGLHFPPAKLLSILGNCEIETGQFSTKQFGLKFLSPIPIRTHLLHGVLIT